MSKEKDYDHKRNLVRRIPELIEARKKISRGVDRHEVVISKISKRQITAMLERVWMIEESPMGYIFTEKFCDWITNRNRKPIFY